MIGASLNTSALWEMYIRLQVSHKWHVMRVSMRELRMEPMNIWPVLKRLEPLRAHIPKEYKALFASQWGWRLNKEKAELAAVATIGCIMLDDAPDSIMRHYDIVAMESLLECLRGGRGHLRLQGLTHVQGGCMVLEPFANVLHFSEPMRNLERACFEHCRHLLEDVVGNKVGLFLLAVTVIL